MKYVRLGKTGLLVSRTSFGALPIQRIEQQEVTRILNRAFDAGINFYDYSRHAVLVDFDNDADQDLAVLVGNETVLLATTSMPKSVYIALSALCQPVSVDMTNPLIFTAVFKNTFGAKAAPSGDRL